MNCSTTVLPLPFRDMTDNPPPISGDPHAIAETARRLIAAATGVSDVGQRLHFLAATDNFWWGTAAERAHDRTLHLAAPLTVVAEAYRAGGEVLRRYAIQLDDLQHAAERAQRRVRQAESDVAAARHALTSALAHDAATRSVALGLGVPPPPATAPRYSAAVTDAEHQLAAAKEQFTSCQERFAELARSTARRLDNLQPPARDHRPWWHTVTHPVTHWISHHWAHFLRQTARLAQSIGTVAGVVALLLAAVAVAFPPLEIAAGATEALAAVSNTTAGVARAAVELSEPTGRTAGLVDLATVSLPGPARRIVAKTGVGRLEAPTHLAIRRPPPPSRDIPLGFRNRDEFAAFGERLRRGLAEAGYPNAVAIMQGSSVTGVSFRTKQPFDVGRRSDFDIALCDESLFRAAKHHGVDLRAYERTAPLKAGKEESVEIARQLGIDELQRELSARSRRDVDFMIFRYTGTALIRAQSIPFPPWRDRVLGPSQPTRFQ